MKRTVRVTILAVGMVTILFSPVLGLLQPAEVFSQDPLAGSRVFGAKGCSGCHAVNGVGGKLASDLARISNPRTFYDLASAMWNHIPEMAAKMRQLGKPPVHLSPRETGNLIAFLTTVNYFNPIGDAKAGKKVFTDKQCVLCHQMEHVGGVFGPSLDSVTQFGAIFFATAMWNHGPTMAAAMDARGIKRPVFSGIELRDLTAYVKSVSRARGDEPIQELPGPTEEGERLFIARGCVDCHGFRATGGPVGPALAGRKLYPSLFEFAAAMWNKGPAMAREMKRRAMSIPVLQANELADIVGYLYSVDYFAGAGDPDRGGALVKAKGCLNCHSIRGKGGQVGPDFAKIRGFNRPANVVSAMWNHGVAMENKVREKAVAWPAFKGDEMAQVVGFLEALGRSRR